MLSVESLTEQPCSGESADLVYKVAADAHEREAAFRLLHHSYVRAGLIQPNAYGMRVTPYNLLPTTEVFVAMHQEEVICTVSLVRDGEMGLPMEAIYGDEIARLRGRGAVLAEVSGLADRRRNIDRFFPLFMRLVRVLCPYAKLQGVTELVVAVHPRHARFYQRFLKFERVGQEKTYPQVCDRPAVALSLHFARMEHDWPDVYELLFGAKLSPSELMPRPMSADERDNLREISACCGNAYTAMYTNTGNAAEAGMAAAYPRSAGTVLLAGTQ